ncbi:hypothetical protein [Leptospirillum ferriphilum]|uniref:hypothetical protein n=1 Tax=Leptospirillum ferriphilum TaxID=178606 RepID=UPI000686B303|nr:hypothetical protein [Leptospirillum ferriphilum]
MKRAMILSAIIGLIFFASAKLSFSSATSFGDGTFIVGKDIQPGTYRSRGGDDCIWERLSGFGGTFSDVIASDTMSKNPIVTIEPIDKGFKSENCGIWHRVSK